VRNQAWKLDDEDGKRKRALWKHNLSNVWMEIRIRDDVFPLLSERNKVKKRPSFLARNILRRVTGGANGLGEHMRSFTTDEQYTPKARTMSKLDCESASMLA
jgi:hypothetical protein